MIRSRTFRRIFGVLSVLFATSLLLALAGCGGGSSDPEDTWVAPPADTEGDSGSVEDIDTPPVDAEADTPGGGDVEPVCTDNASCEGEVVVGDCEEAVCDDGTCVAQRATEAPECCIDDAECDDGDPETEDSCPTPGEACENVDPPCTDDASCDGEVADLGACDMAVCNDGACEAERETAAPACCVDDADCDDEDAATADSCPAPGDACVYTDVCIDDDSCDTLMAGTDLAPCDGWTCDTGTGVCSAARETQAPDCCLDATECNDMNPGTEDTCPVVGEACVIVPLVCTDAQWCVDHPEVHMLFAGDCEVLACNVGTGECYIETLDVTDCCTTDNDCDDNNAATIDTCPVIGGECLNTPDECMEQNVIPFEATFASGTFEGMAVFDYNEADTVSWNLAMENGYDDYSVYLGDPRCGWYFNGENVDENCETPYDPIEDPAYSSDITLELVTPDITLPPDKPYTLGFWIAGESELPDPSLPVGLPVSDNLQVIVTDQADGSEEVVFETAAYDNFIPEPMYVAMDISSYAGRSIRINFFFTTYDEVDNRNPGWWLDEIRVRSLCGPIQCERDLDCADSDGCTNDDCTAFENGDGTAGVCAHNVLPSDCVSCWDEDPGYCNPGECTLAECSAEGRCEFMLDPSPACCDELSVLDEAFDAALPAEWVLDNDGSAVGWQVLADDETGLSTLYFGDPDTMTYDNGATAFGRATTPPIDLPDPEDVQIIGIIAHFELMLSTEFDDTPFEAAVPVDRLTMYISYTDDTGADVEDAIWTSADPAVEGTTNGEWDSIATLLTDYAGKTVQLAFEFNSDDNMSNLYGGAWIDNLVVRTVCGSPCTSDDMCEDGDGCTLDVCDAGVCSNDPAYAGCCETVDDCTLGNECNVASCVESSCVYRDDLDDGTCCPGAAWEEPFAIFELPDYTISEFDYGDPLNPVRWQASEACALSPPYGLYFGDALTLDYNSGFQVGGDILSPEFFVPTSGANAASWIRFDLKLDTEWNGAQWENWENPPSLLTDRLEMFIVRGGTEVKLWDSFAIDYRGSTCPPGDDCDWQSVYVDVTQFQGYNLQVRFVFDSLGDLNNAGMGACIDNLEVVTSCAGAGFPCFGSEDCEPDPEGCERATCSWFSGDPADAEDMGYSQCDYTPTGLPGCCSLEPVREWTWDDGTAEGWDFFPAAATVRWQVANFLAMGQSGLYYLYFGDTETQSYDNPGETVTGVASSPPITLPLSDEMEVHFWYYMDVEFFDATFPTRDRFEVKIIDNLTGDEQVLAVKNEIPAGYIGADPIEWHEFTATIPLLFRGSSVSFEILFDSADENFNDGLGVLIDTFWVEAKICP